MVTGKLGISSSVIRDMEKSGILAIDFSREYRNPIRGLSVGREHLTLTDEQQAAVDAFCESYDQGKRETFLLAGVTGSGKTAVYMEMIDHVLAAGRQVIVLIPEIAPDLSDGHALLPALWRAGVDSQLPDVARRAI